MDSIDLFINRLKLICLVFGKIGRITIVKWLQTYLSVTIFIVSIHNMPKHFVYSKLNLIYSKNFKQKCIIWANTRPQLLEMETEQGKTNNTLGLATFKPSFSEYRGTLLHTPNHNLRLHYIVHKFVLQM